jgi:hypothetical protein
MTFWFGLISTAAAVSSCAAIATCADAQSTPPSPAQTEAATSDLHLVCHGTIDVPTNGRVASFQYSGSNGSSSGQGYIGNSRLVEADLFFDVVVGGAKIKLPGMMVPPVHNRG